MLVTVWPGQCVVAPFARDAVGTGQNVPSDHDSRSGSRADDHAKDNFYSRAAPSTASDIAKQLASLAIRTLRPRRGFEIAQETACQSATSSWRS